MDSDCDHVESLRVTPIIVMIGSMGQSQSAWNRWVDKDFVGADTKSIFESDPWEQDDSHTWISQGHLTKYPDPNVAKKNARHLDWVKDGSENAWSDASLDMRSSWDEPEPTVDTDSKLSTSLYPPDTSITDLSLELKIGEFLMHVKPISDQQFAHCLDLLKACGVARLRHILPWIRSRTWCGAQLRLFLEVHRHWESRTNVHWWETFLWSDREQRWMPRYQRGTLTLNHIYQLVQSRSGCAARDVINERWFEDWENYAVWELGVPSFANFAVFRAGIRDQENWREYLIREDRRSQLEIAQFMDGTFAPFMLPSFRDQYKQSHVPLEEGDPWPELTEFVQQRAAAVGGDLAHAWRDALSRLISA